MKCKFLSGHLTGRESSACQLTRKWHLRPGAQSVRTRREPPAPIPPCTDELMQMARPHVSCSQEGGHEGTSRGELWECALWGWWMLPGQKCSWGAHGAFRGGSLGTELGRGSGTEPGEEDLGYCFGNCRRQRL